MLSLRRTIRTNRIPSGASKLINKMNHHPCFLSILGILPTQLRTLLKDTGHQDREEALDDLSRTLFFSGCNIWAKRQRLASRYWGEIAPENRNIDCKRTKKHKVEDQIVKSKCKNPFLDTVIYQIDAQPNVRAPASRTIHHVVFCCYLTEF